MSCATLTVPHMNTALPPSPLSLPPFLPSSPSLPHLGVEGQAALPHAVRHHRQQLLHVRRLLGVSRHQPELTTQVGLSGREGAGAYVCVCGGGAQWCVC